MTQEELEEIQLTSELAPRKSEKQQLNDSLHSQLERREMCGEVLSESVIETVDHRRHAHDKEIRLAMVQVCRYILVFDCVRFSWVHFSLGEKEERSMAIQRSGSMYIVVQLTKRKSRTRRS